MNENKKLVKAFFTLLAKHTNIKIDLFYITNSKLKDRNKGKRIRIIEEIPIQEAYKVLMDDNAIWKNSPYWEDRYNVYFAPSRQQKMNIAFVDDIENVYRFRQKKHFCLVQTSEEKYQGYFLLNKYLQDDEILQVQRILCKAYKGDTGALSPYQLRRVPGFYNTKYVIDFLVRTVFVGNTVINTQKLKKYYNTGVSLAERQGGGVSLIDINMQDIWEYYFVETQDKSRADMSFCLHLIRRGYTEQEVKKALLEHSENIEKRKGKYLENYLNRTIQKAQKYIEKA